MLCRVPVDDTHCDNYRGDVEMSILFAIFGRNVFDLTGWTAGTLFLAAFDILIVILLAVANG